MVQMEEELGQVFQFISGFRFIISQHVQPTEAIKGIFF